MIAMTQDQYGQPRGPGYAVRGDLAGDEETEDYRAEQSKPMTAFQKVASVIRGDRAAERDEAGAEQDEPAASRMPASSEQATGSDAMAPESGAPGANPPYVTERDEVAMADTPISQQTEQPRDYWDEPETAGRRDEAVDVTTPDRPASQSGTPVPQPRTDTVDHAATEPDMLGTTRPAGDETAAMPAREQAGAATIADVPRATAADTVPAGTTRPAAPPAGTGAAAEAAGTPAGQHAVTPAVGDARPGEAASVLGDFSDLTYGNLVPDAEQYNAQWQQIQFRFVDDPHGSVTEAADIVAQVTTKMEAAIQERQRAIAERQHAIAEYQRSLRERWGEGSNADTEAMRETLRMYKTFLDQLIGPRAGARS
jgi:hypothetical protein